jgi:hypothetical protein
MAFSMYVILVDLLCLETSVLWPMGQHCLPNKDGPNTSAGLLAVQRL